MIAIQPHKQQYSEVESLNHNIILKAKQMTKIKDNVKTTSIKPSEQHECHTSSFEIQEEKSPVTILNDWSRRVNKFKKGDNKLEVKYMFVNIAGHAHQPVFTYRCQVYDITGIYKKHKKLNYIIICFLNTILLNEIGEGSGFSKKEAKKKSAAQLLSKLCTKDNIFNISDVIKPSTTIGNNNNIEANENKSENEIITGGPLTMDDHSDKRNGEL